MISFRLKMAERIESETTETFLHSLQLDKLIALFNKNEVDFRLLMELSETKLSNLLTEMNLSLGNRYKVADRIQKIKAGGKCDILEYV